MSACPGKKSKKTERAGTTGCTLGLFGPAFSVHPENRGPGKGEHWSSLNKKQWQRPNQTEKRGLPSEGVGVQWLRLHASNAGAVGLIPGWETKIPHVMQHGQKIKKKIKKETKRSRESETSLSKHLDAVVSPFCSPLSPVLPGSLGKSHKKKSRSRTTGEKE